MNPNHQPPRQGKRRNALQWPAGAMVQRQAGQSANRQAPAWAGGCHREIPKSCWN